MFHYFFIFKKNIKFIYFFFFFCFNLKNIDLLRNICLFRMKREEKKKNLCSTGHANRRRSPTAQRVQESISYLWSFYYFRSLSSSFAFVVTDQWSQYFHQYSNIFSFLPIKKKRRREKKRYISLSNVRRRKNRYTNIFFSHRFIIMIGASLSHLFFSLFDRLSTNEHEYFTYLIVVSNKIKEEVLYPQGKIDTFILTLLDTFFIIERRSS